jgi:cell division protein FtsW (lipid II flippase)
MIIDDSKVNNIFSFLCERLDVVQIMVTIILQLFVLMDIVQDMSQSHLRFNSLFADLVFICQSAFLVKLLLDGCK